MVTVTIEALEDLTNEELVEERRRVQVEAKLLTDHLGHIDQRIHTLMDANEAQALTDDEGVIIVERKPKGSPSYDQGILRAIIEAPGFNDEAFEECWITEYEEPVKRVPAHWNMGKVLKWARKLGKPVQDIVDRAKLPQATGNLEFKGE